MAFRHGRLSLLLSLCETQLLRDGRELLLSIKQSLVVHSLPLVRSYMDFAGPLIQSVLYKYSCYCGTVDAGSGYGRVWPDRLMTAPVASSAIAKFIAIASGRQRRPPSRLATMRRRA